MNSYPKKDQRTCDVIDVWVTEFLLHRLNPTVDTKKLMSRMNVGDGSNLRKLTILRDLHENLINGAVEERTLDHLELIEMLLIEEGCTNLESLKSAYCWVAVDCTVRYILVMDLKKGRYLDALERIWDGRIKRLKGRNSSLVTQELIVWENDLKKVVLNPDLCKTIRGTNSRYSALSVLRKFVFEQFASLDPPYLENEVERIFGVDRRKLNLNQDEISGGSNGGERPSALEDDINLYDDEEACVLVRKERFLEIDEVAQEEHEQVVDGEESRNMKVFKAKRRKKNRNAIRGVTLNGDPSGGSDDDKENHELGNPINNEKVQDNDVVVPMIDEKSVDVDRSENNTLADAFKDCLMKMMELVSDANLRASKAADLQNAPSPTNKDHGNNIEHLSDNVPDAEVILLDKEKLDNNDVETEANISSKPSPSKRVQQHQTVVRNKGKRSWTPEEEKALREGVKKYGKSWKAIKNAYPDELVWRTEVNLKDKWRMFVGRN